MPYSLKTYFRLLAEDREPGLGATLLRPFLEIASGIYGFISGVTRQMHQRNNKTTGKKLPIPVISVGNLTWGGTGKTPVVEYLARRISEMNRTPLILSRGYSQDEIEQMKHHVPHALFGIGKDRLQSAQKAMSQKKADMAILDDGLQQWALHRDIDMITVNALNPFGNGKLLPRGILREPLFALQRASVIVITHVNLVSREVLDDLKKRIQAIAPKTAILETYMEPLFLYRANKRKRVALQKLQNQKVTTFSGIGMPRSFQLLLSKCQIRPARNFEFNDHHRFSDKELEEIKQISRSASISEIITTEKDFFRSPDAITRILNPLVLATRLRVASGEELLNQQLLHFLGVPARHHEKIA